MPRILSQTNALQYRSYKSSSSRPYSIRRISSPVLLTSPTCSMFYTVARAERQLREGQACPDSLKRFSNAVLHELCSTRKLVVIPTGRRLSRAETNRYLKDDYIRALLCTVSSRCYLRDSLLTRDLSQSIRMNKSRLPPQHVQCVSLWIVLLGNRQLFL